MKKIKRIGEKRFLVQSDRDPEKYYEVDTAMPFCECEGFYYKKKPCKHIKLAKEKQKEYDQLKKS